MKVLGEILREPALLAAALVLLACSIEILVSAIAWFSRSRPPRLEVVGGKRRRRAFPRMASIRLPRGWPLLALIAFSLFALAFLSDGPQGPTVRVEDRAAGGQTISGAVGRVIDGDTIIVAGVRIRLAKLDCPEMGSPAGERARQGMVALVRGRRLECRLAGRRSYDREIGECRLGSGQDVGMAMIRSGLCRRYR